MRVLHTFIQKELTRNRSTVQAHDYAIDLPEVLRHGDILIVAVGCAELVKADWVKPGAVVIDVGINVVEVQTAHAASLALSAHLISRSASGAAQAAHQTLNLLRIALPCPACHSLPSMKSRQATIASAGVSPDISYRTLPATCSLRSIRCSGMK